MHGLAVNYGWTEEYIFDLPMVRAIAYADEIAEDNTGSPVLRRLPEFDQEGWR